MNDPNHPCRSVLPKLINNQYNLRTLTGIAIYSSSQELKGINILFQEELVNIYV